MVHLLSKYLWQYKTVGIPQVGTIQIVRQPSQLDIVNKLIAPPGYVAELKSKEEVSEHQLHFLAMHLHKSKDEVTTDLQFFGGQLQDKINGPGFEWTGLGMLTRSTQSLPVLIDSLQPLPAQRVIRTDVPHTILVGDEQRSSIQNTVIDEPVAIVKKRMPVLILIAWILLLLAIITIVCVLYIGKFKVNASGSQVPATSYNSPVQPASIT